MRTLYALCLFALCSGTLFAQQPPQATQLPGDVFLIKTAWYIGGAGPWDYMAMDPSTNRLFIAHGSQVQVVDVETGALAGQITGLHEAHDIAFDASGEFGFISDGPANQVAIFDRRSLQVVATIDTGPAPRALAIDAQTGLLFAICTNPFDQAATPAANAAQQRPGSANSNAAARIPDAQRSREMKTSISVIDVSARRLIGQILMPGRLGFAQSDGNGQVFVLVVDRNQVARLDASAIAALLHQKGDSGAAAKTEPVTLDWSHEARQPQSAQESMRVFGLGPACQGPRSLGVDGAHQRLFAACDNMKLAVLNGGSGETITSLPIGPGADTVGYDPGQGLIYTANGGAQGTLTIIRQDVTDTYAVIQNLFTRQRARTLAVNASTGNVYLVTDYVGVNLAQSGGIGTLKTSPVAGSFQVLVIGH